MRYWVVMLLVLILVAPAHGESLPMTASALVDFASDTLGSGFIYGASGQICNVNFRYGRAKLYPEWADLILSFGRQWDGKPIYDCLGLIKAFAHNGAELTTKSAYTRWISESGPLLDAVLQPGMLVFRLDGDVPNHVGVYIGDGKVIHARGTRWGVIQETLPAGFTHWAKINWLDYNMPCDRNPVVIGQYLDVGSIAVVQTDNAQPMVVSSVEYRAGKTRETIGMFADGALLTVIEVTNDICRLVEGVGTKGEYLKGYARLINLRDSNAR